MSAELVAKKRGRPRKTVTEPLEVDAVEAKSPAKASKTTRAKSTTAAPKVTATKKATSVKVTKSKKTDEPIIEPYQADKPKSKPESASPSPLKSPASSPRQDAQEVPARTPVTPETSKILEQVRQLSTKPAFQSTEPSNTSPQPSTTQANFTSKLQASTKAATRSDTSKPTPPPSESPAQTKSKLPSVSKSPPTPQNNAPPPKPKIPIAALNSAVVSNISERAGARPNTPGSKALPKNYQSAARKVTMTIVALPIAIVTSYVLYQRLVLGEEKQLLTMPRTAVDIQSPKNIPGDEESKGQSA